MKKLLVLTGSITGGFGIGYLVLAPLLFSPAYSVTGNSYPEKSMSSHGGDFDKCEDVRLTGSGEICAGMQETYKATIEKSCDIDFTITRDGGEVNNIKTGETNKTVTIQPERTGTVQVIADASDCECGTATREVGVNDQGVHIGGQMYVRMKSMFPFARVGAAR